jgi:hypothetical protein
MSFYVERESEHNPTGLAYVGPIRSAVQAERERQAWEDCGHPATVLESGPETRAKVRAWEKAKRAS